MAAKAARLLTFSIMVTLRESIVLAGAVLSLNMLHIKRSGRSRGVMTAFYRTQVSIYVGTNTRGSCELVLGLLT